MQDITATYERMRLRVFLSITLGYSFFYLARLGFSVVKKPMLDAHILTADQMGLIGSALLISYGIGKVMNGFFADYVSPRRLFATGLLVAAIANIFFGLSKTFYFFLIFWAINGWFQSVGVPVSGVVLSSWFSNKERGSRYSLWSIAHHLGEGMSFTLTAFLVSIFGWQAGFFGPGAVSLVVALVLYKTLVDRPESHGLPPIEDYKSDETGRMKEDSLSTRQLQLAILKNRFVWLIGMASALLYVTRYAINNWGMLYLQLDRGYSLQEAGLAVSLFPIIGLIGTILSGTISDRFFQARRAPVSCMYGFLLILSLGALLYVPAGHPWLVYVSMATAGFAVGGQLVFLGGLAAMDLCPKKVSGAALGFIGGFSYLGAALQDFFSGRMIQAGHLASGGTTYDFSQVKIFWLGSAVLSFFFSFSLWWAEAKNGVRYKGRIVPDAE